MSSHHGLLALPPAGRWSSWHDVGVVAAAAIVAALRSSTVAVALLVATLSHVARAQRAPAAATRPAGASHGSTLLPQAAAPLPVGGRAAEGVHPADSLVARALAVSPQLRATRQRVRAAEARVTPAGIRPDPMLTAAIQSFPVGDPGFSDFMTMKMVGVSQTFPARGKLAGARRAAVQELAAARAEADASALVIARDVRGTYYDIAYIDQALAIVARTRDVLVSLLRATEARYEVGTAGQHDVLRARLESARLGDDAAALREERSAAAARLNALLDRPTDAPIGPASIPAHIVRAAVADPPGRIRFVSATLGSRAADSPLPPLDSLQAVATRQSPALRAHQAMIAAQAARVDLARLERRPDIDVSLQYGQRDGFRDMITAMVSVPLPIQRRRKQDELAAAAGAELAAIAAEHHQRSNAIRADVARLYTQIERARTQLALTVKSVLPQSRATFEVAVASYQTGRAEFVTMLEAQSTLFSAETNYFRALSDFAKALAELEQVVGQEILS